MKTVVVCTVVASVALVAAAFLIGGRYQMTDGPRAYRLDRFTGEVVACGFSCVRQRTQPATPNSSAIAGATRSGAGAPASGGEPLRVVGTEPDTGEPPSVQPQ